MRKLVPVCSSDLAYRKRSDWPDSVPPWSCCVRAWVRSSDTAPRLRMFLPAPAIKD